MKILSKTRDYWHYYSHLYGDEPDDPYVYDVRSKTPITTSDVIWFLFRTLRNGRYEPRAEFILEVGDTQYFLWSRDVVDLSTTENPHTYDASFTCKKLEFTRKVFKAPIAIGPAFEDYKRSRYIRLPRDFDSLSFDQYDHPRRPYETIDDPILRDTMIPSLISAEEVYKALDSWFVTTKRDGDADITNSDLQKAEIAGFDKRWSFRHPTR